jgi:small-conductance mechanosensitive channel
MSKAWKFVLYVLNLPLIPVGKTIVTLAMLLYIILLFTLLVASARYCRRKVVDKVLEKSKLDMSMQNALAMFLQYSFIGIGSIIILNTAGIEMTALTVVAGALGLGLSLGLQTIAKSVAGGVMILIERPIRIGDRIQIGSTTGDVIRIALRSTTVHTDDHIDIIVPNFEFMDQKIINWTYSSRKVILTLPITITDENELSRVKELLEQAAKNNSKVIEDPKPEILFESFDSGKLKLTLRVATEDYLNASQVRSELMETIYNSFVEANIELN